MNRLKAALLLISFSFIITLPASASIFTGATKDNFQNNVNAVAQTSPATASLEDIIGTVVRAALSVLGAIFVTLMFITGNDWMQAAGNEEKIKKARARIQSLLIGLVIVVLGYALSYGFSSILAKFIKGV